MRVLVNSWFGYALKTGVGFYVDQLVRHLGQLRPEVETLCFRPPLDGLMTLTLQGTQGLRAGAGRRPELARGFAAAPVMRTAWNTARDMYFGWVCRWNEVDLYHEPNYIPLAYDGPIVTTVHDMSVLLYPEWHPIDRVHYFEKHFYDRLGATSRFIADSQFTRQEMIAHLPVDPDRVDVVPLAARTGFRPMAEPEFRPVLKRLGLPNKYLLFVGTIEPRKNLLGLLRSYATLPPAIKSEYPLLIVGRWGWRSQEIAEEFKRNEDSVILAGYVSEHDMAAVFNGATAMVYPSLYEGFGLPPLEMMACGRPVIVSNRSSLPEVVGSAGITVEPDDTDAIAAAIRELIENPELAEQLADQGLEQALQFSWMRTASRTAEVYRRALDRALPMARAA